jgi:hypothetical protein
MISLVDPSDLENVLRPTVYRPVITSEARDLALRGANGEIPRFARDDSQLAAMTQKKPPRSNRGFTTLLKIDPNV